MVNLYDANQDNQCSIQKIYKGINEIAKYKVNTLVIDKQKRCVAFVSGYFLYDNYILSDLNGNNRYIQAEKNIDKYKNFPYHEDICEDVLRKKLESKEIIHIEEIKEINAFVGSTIKNKERVYIWRQKGCLQNECMPDNNKHLIIIKTIKDNSNVLIERYSFGSNKLYDRRLYNKEDSELKEVYIIYVPIQQIKEYY